MKSSKLLWLEGLFVLGLLLIGAVTVVAVVNGMTKTTWLLAVLAAFYAGAILGIWVEKLARL